MNVLLVIIFAMAVNVVLGTMLLGARRVWKRQNDSRSKRQFLLIAALSAIAALVQVIAVLWMVKSWIWGESSDPGSSTAPSGENGRWFGWLIDGWNQFWGNEFFTIPYLGSFLKFAFIAFLIVFGLNLIGKLWRARRKRAERKQYMERWGSQTSDAAVKKKRFWRKSEFWKSLKFWRVLEPRKLLVVLRVGDPIRPLRIKFGHPLWTCDHGSDGKNTRKFADKSGLYLFVPFLDKPIEFPGQTFEIKLITGELSSAGFKEEAFSRMIKESPQLLDEDAGDEGKVEEQTIGAQATFSGQLLVRIHNPIDIFQLTENQRPGEKLDGFQKFVSNIWTGILQRPFSQMLVGMGYYISGEPLIWGVDKQIIGQPGEEKASKRWANHQLNYHDPGTKTHPMAEKGSLADQLDKFGITVVRFNKGDFNPEEAVLAKFKERTTLKLERYNKRIELRAKIDAAEAEWGERKFRSKGSAIFIRTLIEDTRRFLTGKDMKGEQVGPEIIANWAPTPEFMMQMLEWSERYRTIRLAQNATYILDVGQMRSDWQNQLPEILSKLTKST